MPTPPTGASHQTSTSPSLHQSRPHRHRSLRIARFALHPLRRDRLDSTTRRRAPHLRRQSGACRATAIASPHRPHLPLLHLADGRDGARHACLDTGPHTVLVMFFGAGGSLQEAWRAVSTASLLVQSRCLATSFSYGCSLHVQNISYLCCLRTTYGGE